MYHDLMNIFLLQLSKIIIVSFGFCCIFERELRTNWWLFSAKILAGYQVCHMTCHLKISSLNLRLDKKSQKLQSFTILHCPPIYLHLIFAILQVEILSLMNWIFLPAVACKIQVWNKLKIQFIKLDISNWRIAKNQVQIDRVTWLLNLPLL